MKTCSLRCTSASGIPICPHADTDTVTLQSVDSLTRTVQSVEKYEVIVWDLAGAVVKLAMAINQID